MKESYHHGDLKSTLIEAGVKLLSEEGVEGLSLRKLAREVGVSHNAPYMHFSDKEAVLAAIAQQGFQLLGEAVDAGQQMALTDSLEGRLTAVAQSYVKFAIDHPNHLMVMFGKLDASDHPELMQTSHATFHQLTRIVEAASQADQAGGYQPEHIAMLLWINIHGLSTLLIAQKIPSYARQGFSDEQLTQMSVQALCRGILQK